jgi:peptidoglycan/LPS O-acetylase OafA/YrhL
MTGGTGGRSGLKHQPALDGLRGLAVAGVLLFHGGHLRGGFLGVDAFFVLSGFLITSLLLVAARNDGRVGLGAFWARRARRLLPALACVIVFVALYALLLAKPAELATIRDDAFATVGYVANWHEIANSHDYWALFRSPSPLDHTWSLAIEEQFYVLWPLLVAGLVVASRAGITARRVLVASITLAVVSIVWSEIIFDPNNPSRVYYGTDSRVASILIGAALAALLAFRPEITSRRARVALEGAGVGSFVLLMVAWTRFSGSSTLLFRGGLVLCGIATAVVIAAVVHSRRGPLGRMLAFGPLCALGMISYGVYLWHWPIYIVLDRSRLHFGGWPLLAVQVAVTIAVAIVSFRFVEQPIRRGTGAWAAPRVRRVVVASGTALAVVITAIVVSTARAPAPERLQADPIRTYVEPARPVASARTARAHAQSGVASAPVPSPRILVVGDSVALFEGDEGLKQLHTTPPLDVLNLGTIGCKFLPEESRWRDNRSEPQIERRHTCGDKWAYAIAAFQPDVVMMLLADPGTSVHDLSGQWTQPCEPTYQRIFESELHDQIGVLAARGARVVIATAPYFGIAQYLPPQWYTNDDCQNASRRHVVASDPHAVLADVFNWLCTVAPPHCMTHRGGIELRPDGMHFRHASARLLAVFLIAQAQRHGVLRGVRVDEPEASLLAADSSR